MSKAPWSKFFWSDWESDERLYQCSLEAQALWMRMLCVCAKGDPYGYLAVAGHPLGAADVARRAGITTAKAEELMAELAQWGVYSQDRKGRIYSRRMVKDQKAARTAQKNGKRGGNPKLHASSQDARENETRDNHEDKGADKPQRPEARGQNPPSRPPTTSSLTDQALADEFERWWQQVPRKVGRKAAWKAFKSARQEASFGTLVSAIQAFAKQVEGKEKRYVPHPATWLNQGRWMDEDLADQGDGGENTQAAEEVRQWLREHGAA